MSEIINPFLPGTPKPEDPMNPFGPINNIDDLCECYRLKKETLKEGTDELTYCKTWFKWDEKKLTLGTNIEETGGELEETLEFPFCEEDFEAVLEDLDIFVRNERDKFNGNIDDED